MTHRQEGAASINDATREDAGILAVDDEGVIVEVDATAERLFGYGRHELDGQNVDVLLPVDKEVPLQRSLPDVSITGRRKDGSEILVDVDLVSDGTVDGWVVTAGVRDATDRIAAEASLDRSTGDVARQQLEAQLHQSQRLESLGQLAGGVAHDFNNLLAVILNYTEFIADELVVAANGPDGQRWDAVRDDVGQVRRAAQRASELTHSLLAFGRREVVRPRALTLDDVVADIVPLLRRTLGEQVEIKVPSRSGRWSVHADPGQVEQVLLNLAVNARDAMPDGGTLTIDTTDTVVDEDYASARPGITAGNYVRLRVSDSGTGMTDDVIGRAFEPFFTTKPKGQGSGLGLATVYGIITQAGGHVRIYSEPGVGTSVSAFFPATEAAPTPAAAIGVTRAVRGGETILVVEDESAMREVTRRILERHGHPVLLAAGGREALELAERHVGAIDLLLTDVVMPQMLGKEVAERIRESRPGICVLYMSGYARPIFAAHGTLDPGLALIGKPFTGEELLRRIREVLSGADGAGC